MTLCRSRRRQVVGMQYCRLFCWAHNPTVGGSIARCRPRICRARAGTRDVFSHYGLRYGLASATGDFQRLRGRPPLVSHLKSRMGRSFTAVATIELPHSLIPKCLSSISAIPQSLGLYPSARLDSNCSEKFTATETLEVFLARLRTETSRICAGFVSPIRAVNSFCRSCIRETLLCGRGREALVAKSENCSADV
jgi:hypothetical protein